MKEVRIYDVDQDTGVETFSHAAVLVDCFEAGDPELIDVEGQLEQQGRAWVGGGASPLRLLTLIRSH